MLVLPNRIMSSESDALTIMTLQKQVSRVNPGLPEAVTRLSNVGDQLICWLCAAKKPVFMLLHEFMQHRMQLFSYPDNGYLHQTMELPTAQEKRKQIFLAYLKVHQYKFRDKQDCSATFTAPKVKKNKRTHK
jgi:hypothetical protein